MKNNYLFIIIAILSTYVMPAQTTHTIVLTCDTSKITKDNVNEVCSFGQDSGVSNEDYTKDAKVGDIVVWRAKAINSEFPSSIDLTQVNHEGGKNVFGKNTLRGDEGIISGKVVQGQPGDEEKYNLKFKVYVDGKKVNGTFTIDPKIRIRGLSNNGRE